MRIATISVPSLTTPCRRSSRSSNTTVTPASLDQRTHDLLGHMRLEGPHRVFAGHLSLAEIVVRRLELPGLWPLVMLPHAPIELACQAPDRLLVANVGGPESAAGQSAQMFAGLDQDGDLTHPLHLDRCRDTGGSSSVDDDVGRGGECGYRPEQVSRSKRGSAACVESLCVDQWFIPRCPARAVATPR